MIFAGECQEGFQNCRRLPDKNSNIYYLSDNQNNIGYCFVEHNCRRLPEEMI